VFRNAVDIRAETCEDRRAGSVAALARPHTGSQRRKSLPMFEPTLNIPNLHPQERSAMSVSATDPYLRERCEAAIELAERAAKRFRLDDDGLMILAALLVCQDEKNHSVSASIEDIEKLSGYAQSAIREFLEWCNAGGILSYNDEGGEYYLRFFDLPPSPPSKSNWQKIRRKVFARDGEVCRYCGREDGVFHIDHIIPRSRGGLDEMQNLTVACAKCNISKNARTPDEWKGAL
jgi:hypothetical protein